MNFLAILPIRFYQKFISPYKGFRCAHAHLHQQDSCSTAVIKIIEQKGILKALPFIRKRFDDCRLAFELIEKKKKDDKSRDWYDCGQCYAESACEVINCSKSTKYCDDISVCDCSLF